MDRELAQISIDLSVILRIITAFLWGWGYGYLLHYTRKGQLFEREYTWLATVLGIGVDLLIAFPEGWWIVSVTIAVSSIGIIILAMIHGYPKEINPNSYKLKHGLEDSTALAMAIITDLTGLLKSGLRDQTAAEISGILAMAHQLRERLSNTRAGR